MQQLSTLSEVVASPDAPSVLLAALRRLVDAGKGIASSFVTLDHLLLVNALLQNAKALCSGPAFAAKSFDERVDVAVQVLVGRRGMLAAGSQLGGSVGMTSGDSSGTSSSAGSKMTGGYDSVRLQHVKFSIEYVESKAQFLQLWDSGHIDAAILVLLRGASSVDASGASSRSAPLKIFHDLLFGTKDVYVIDQDMERQIKSAREHLPALFGRRVAKSLGETLERDVPLTGLVASLAKMETWSVNPPNFYELAFVPVRKQMGDLEAALHIDKGFVRGQPMFENRLITDCCTDMIVSLMSDLGLVSTACTAADYATANISSVDDAFGMTRVFLQQFGSLTTAQGRAGTVLGKLFGEFGARQAATRQSVDPQRLLEKTFVVLPSLALANFQREREMQKDGRKVAANLAASGYFISAVQPMPPLPVPPPGLPPPLIPSASDQAAAERKRKAEFDRELNAGIQAGLKKALKGNKAVDNPKLKPATPSDELPPSTMSMQNDGNVLLIEGGKRNALGCRYLMNGNEGLTSAVEAALPGCCPVYFAAIRGGFLPDEMALLPCHAEHGSDSAEHPDDTAVHAAKSVKLADFRINEDGTKFASYKPQGGGGAGGGRKSPKPQRKRKMSGGPGCRKVAFGALASLGGAFGSSTTSACSAALLLTLASSASTSQPFLSGAAVVGAPRSTSTSPLMRKSGCPALRALPAPGVSRWHRSMQPLLLLLVSSSRAVVRCLHTHTAHLQDVYFTP